MPAEAPNWPAAVTQRGLNVSLKAVQLVCVCVRSERLLVMFPSGLRASRWPLPCCPSPTVPPPCIPSGNGVSSLSGLRRPKQMMVRGWHQGRGPHRSKNTCLAFSEGYSLAISVPLRLPGVVPGNREVQDKCAAPVLQNGLGSAIWALCSSFFS